ncbi:ABC transporter permease [Schlegelella sp. S2-27]|uniref:ABC transporter permease n=1 Tax=Caldimonas mangrovi TaxID=2944811 RepID=A0ABT0YMP7_9BURK|nr:ABC transporter permease [Caldimonas mangrovi]MCM5679639.1 ABC transporter permease [Caldimonas mangrovi]
MDASLRRVSWRPATAAGLRTLIVAVFLLPLTAAVGLGLGQALQAGAWPALWRDRQFAPAWAVSVWIGAASSALSLAIVWWAVPRLHAGPAWPRLLRLLGPALAVPHVAFAVGFALLWMPSGVLARLWAPAAGWAWPPDVATVQDPWGLALIAALVCKEVPFLLWNVAALLAQAGAGAQWQQQRQVCASMGYGRIAAWRHVLWPQLMPRLAWPLAAVLAYGLTGVDMALVLGPTTPPTLAVLAWQWLLDPDADLQARGGAAVCVLSLSWVVMMGAAWGLARALGRVARGQRASGRRGAVDGGASGAAAWTALAALYAAVAATLLFVSVAGVWSFPSLLPQAWTLDAWGRALASGGSVGTTFTLALASSCAAMALVVGWMETAPARWDTGAAPAVYATMVLPSLLVSLGLYRLALACDLDGRWAGVWWAHTLFAAPYVWVALAPAYRAYDERYRWTACSLGRSTWSHLWQVKWPILRTPIAAALAVGFAVSVAQYLPTQFVGAGRIATVTTEAVTLASGGQRSLLAAFAALQSVLPLLAFGAATAVGRRTP